MGVLPFLGFYYEGRQEKSWTPRLSDNALLKGCLDNALKSASELHPTQPRFGVYGPKKVPKVQCREIVRGSSDTGLPFESSVRASTSAVQDFL